MLDQTLRIYKERLLEPIAAQVGAFASPLQITLVGFVAGVGACLAAWQQMYGLALVLWLLNRLLDGLDGTVARSTGRQSDFGGYLDIVLDDVIYAGLALALALSVNTVGAYIAAGVLLALYRVNAASWMMLAALLEKRAHGAQVHGEMTSVTMPHGLSEGTETIVFYVLCILFPTWLVALYSILAVLVVVMVIQRLLWAWQNLR